LHGSSVTGNTAGRYSAIENFIFGTLEINGLVCDNTPADDQCGGGGHRGNCPNPSSGICSGALP
jgi:hypothetical protein